MFYSLLFFLAKQQYLNSFEIINLGSGKGTSVLELVKAFELISGVNIKINISQTSDGIDGVLKKYNELKTKKNFNGINSELIREISLIKNNFEQLYTLEAFKDEEIVALIVISAQSKNSIYLIGWTNDLGRKLNANNLLLWEAIIYLKEEKFTTFDFRVLQYINWF